MFLSFQETRCKDLPDPHLQDGSCHMSRGQNSLNKALRPLIGILLHPYMIPCIVAHGAFRATGAAAFPRALRRGCLHGSDGALQVKLGSRGLHPVYTGLLLKNLIQMPILWTVVNKMVLEFLKFLNSKPVYAELAASDRGINGFPSLLSLFFQSTQAWSIYGFCIRNRNYGLGYILHIREITWALRVCFGGAGCRGVAGSDSWGRLVLKVTLSPASVVLWVPGLVPKTLSIQKTKD